MPADPLPAAIRAYLLADTAIVALVGSRIHYKGLPDSSDYPHIWFARTGRDEDETLDGDGLVFHRFAVEIVSEPSAAKPDGDGELITAAVFDRLHNSDGPFGAVEIDSAFLEDLDDTYVFKSVDSEDRLFLKAFELLVIQ